MSQFLFQAGIGSQYSSILALQDEDKSDYWLPRHAFIYQSRGLRSAGQFSYLNGWSRPGFLCGDPSQTTHMFGGNDVDSVSGGYDDPSNGDTGAMRNYFIHGICVDGSSNPLAGATLVFYLTSTKQLVGTCTTDSNGVYSMGTPYVGQQHFAYANYGPDTYLGGSVDTLVPVSSPW